MHEYTPRPNRTVPYVAVFFLMIAGIVLFMPNGMSYDASLWLRTAGIWAFAIAFIIADRYLLTSYTYIIDENENGTFDFVVSELHFRRRRTVCRISLSEIASISRIEKKKKTKLPKKARVLYYFAEVAPQNLYLLHVVNEDGEAYLKFTPDAKTAEIIASAIENK